MPRPWTVLPHQPIEKLQENLWTVEASLPQGPLRRRMGIARLGDGQLVFFNAIALDDASMKQIEAWGKPAFALTANGFHRLDLGSYKARYPGLRVLAAPAARKRIGQMPPWTAGSSCCLRIRACPSRRSRARRWATWRAPPTPRGVRRSASLATS